MARIKDRTGQRYGRLVAVERVGCSSTRDSVWRCVCDCGQEVTVLGGNLTAGTSTSCGCYQRESCGNMSRRHGGKETPEYVVWQSMKRRCEDPARDNYPRYGGRGIRVCERWQSFENFLADMGPRPSPKHSIDRIDSEGDYCPENCRWATAIEQANNKSNNRLLTACGKTQTLAEWVRETGLSSVVIRERINRGWSVERALTTPARKHLRQGR